LRKERRTKSKTGGKWVCFAGLHCGAEGIDIFLCRKVAAANSNGSKGASELIVGYVDEEIPGYWAGTHTLPIRFLLRVHRFALHPRRIRACP